MSSIESISLNKVPSFQASKWLHIMLLCDTVELRELFSTFGDKVIVSVAGVNKEGEEIVPQDKFLENYANYIDLLKNGQPFTPSQLHQWFTSAISVDLQHYRKIPVGNNENIIRIVYPVLQIKPHWFDYSMTDQKIRSNTFGLDNISWGLQFSYPQLFEDPYTKQIHKVFSEEQFSNTKLFKSLQRWMRKYSRVTSFQVGDRLINAPIRTGNNSFSWVNAHPSLAKKGMHVK
ncbi:hypothetical protein PHSC3_001521 [Chlamydiales bacterium STE3]|nr:hypothetical protein PHSC3_001521 [Chlamydiales bacterium STE3]